MRLQRRRRRRHLRHFPLIKVKATASALEVKRRFVRLLALASTSEEKKKGRKQTRNLVVANDRLNEGARGPARSARLPIRHPSIDRSCRLSSRSTRRKMKRSRVMRCSSGGNLIISRESDSCRASLSRATSYLVNARSMIPSGRTFFASLSLIALHQRWRGL